ncbi:hypothetical protein VP01_2856g3 [Puccinia sorghi]|uniref:Uncharacterized protein n=1 Tax=Puccinia sorghi TaxID=27349 RepID=A0A0L6V1Y9_9BASI|nr:hypothetical protein VP01_2856g3 [Puccinia sorghi]
MLGQILGISNNPLCYLSLMATIRYTMKSWSTQKVNQEVWNENLTLCRDFHERLYSEIEKQFHISHYYC